MIYGHTILCFASGHEAPPTSKHHVMHILAERNVVLWINYHASRRPTRSSSDLSYLTGKIRQIFRGLSNPRENLYVLTPLQIPWPGSSLVRRLNRILLVRQIKNALRRVQKGPMQIWSFAPDIAYLLEKLSAQKVLYYCVDDFASFSGYDAGQVLRDEADLCRRADLVVTTSSALQEAKRPLNPNTILVTHGVDYRHFAKALSNNLPIPEDISNIPHPVLGFFGLIRDWVDLDLLADAARRKPDWHFVLLGDSTIDLTPYRDLSNMHFLGRKPYESLPAYCRQFDVGLIPFRINDLTKAVNPIKLREYLAAGLPVVSSRLPEVEQYDHLVQIFHVPQDFATVVEKALACSAEDRQQRTDAMAGETWPEKVNLITRRLMEPSEVNVK